MKATKHASSATVNTRVLISKAALIGGFALVALVISIRKGDQGIEPQIEHTRSDRLVETTGPEPLGEDTSTLPDHEAAPTLSELFASADSEETLRHLLSEYLPEYESEAIQALDQIDYKKLNLYWLQTDMVDYLANRYDPLGGIYALGGYVNEAHPLHWNIAQALLTHHASSADPEALDAFMSNPTNLTIVSSVAHDLGSQIAINSPLRAIDTAHKFTGVTHNQMLNGALLEWFKEEPVAVAEYLNTVDSDAKYDDVTDAYVSYIKYNEPSVAMDWAMEIQSKDYRSGTVVEVADVWKAQDPDGFFNWYTQLEEKDLKTAIAKELKL